MKTVFRSTEDVPEYALPYLVNGDDSGLSPEDKPVIDKWLTYWQGIAKEKNGNLIISPLDTEPFFSRFPAFGLACNVQETVMMVVTDEIPAFKRYNKDSLPGMSKKEAFESMPKNVVREFDYALPQNWLDDVARESGMDYYLILGTTVWCYFVTGQDGPVSCCKEVQAYYDATYYKNLECPLK